MSSSRIRAHGITVKYTVGKFDVQKDSSETWFINFLSLQQNVIYFHFVPSCCFMEEEELTAKYSKLYLLEHHHRDEYRYQCKGHGSDI